MPDFTSWVVWIVIGGAACGVLFVAGGVISKLIDDDEPFIVFACIGIIAAIGCGITSAVVHDHYEYTHWRDACRAAGHSVHKLGEGSDVFVSGQTVIVSDNNTYGCEDSRGRVLDTYTSDTD